MCVVGCGALGSALLDRLRQDGCRQVLLVDGDEVESRNLELSPLLRRAAAHAAEAAGTMASRNKAMLLALAAQAVDGLPWRFADCEIADVGWSDLRDMDLFCCCTDSVLSRLELSWIARSLGKPMLDGAVFGRGIAAGRVTALPPCVEAPCFLCSLSEDRRAAVLGYAASTSLGCQVPESVPAMTGTLATLHAVADAMLASLRDWPHTAPQHEGRTVRLTQAANGIWQRESLRLQRSATCPWHDSPTATLVELPWEEPLSASLPSPGAELLLNWPICTEAVCEACHARSQPMQRIARVRRAACTVCGRPMQRPVRALHRIRHQDRESALSPRQLGMPDRHLYWVQNSQATPQRRTAP